MCAGVDRSERHPNDNEPRAPCRYRWSALGFQESTDDTEVQSRVTRELADSPVLAPQR
jgi:hypothetical protein